LSHSSTLFVDIDVWIFMLTQPIMIAIKTAFFVFVIPRLLATLKKDKSQVATIHDGEHINVVTSNDVEMVAVVASIGDSHGTISPLVDHIDTKVANDDDASVQVASTSRITVNVDVSVNEPSVSRSRARAHSYSMSMSYRMTDGDRARLGHQLDDDHDDHDDDNNDDHHNNTNEEVPTHLVVIDDDNKTTASASSTAEAARNAHGGYAQGQRRVVRATNMAVNAIGIIAGHNNNNRGVCTTGTATGTSANRICF
jgi:hypothetical protein